ncbi:hypothetical protein [Paraconexibacter sp.]|uniref:hypothetical protein n=1 Tax=Paraconexibacter sp. TaxID=2949640 RepID=UPI00356427D1
MALRVAGPRLDDLRAYPAYALRYVRGGRASERLGVGYAAIGAFALVFPQLFYWTHHNPGPAELDPVLVGLQASQAITVFLKMFVFETLVLRAGPKLSMRVVVAGLFVVQWPLMLSMFSEAPLPYVHAIAEVFATTLVIVGYRRWRDRADLVPAPTTG